MRAALRQVEISYFDYRDQFPPQELDEIIVRQDLELPVVFVNGTPRFQGALPTVQDLVGAITSPA